MDLSKSFKQAVRMVLGDSLIIVDRFHFMRQIYWGLDEVCREVQREVYKKTRIHMKRSKKLFKRFNSHSCIHFIMGISGKSLKTGFL
nr:transposase [Sediminibacillus terrae]